MAIENLCIWRGQPDCFQKCGVKIGVGGAGGTDALFGHLVWPADEQGNADTAFVQFAFSTTQGLVTRHIGFATIVARENEDGIFFNSQLFQLLPKLPNSIINALQHRCQMRVVIGCPVIQ